MISLVYVGSKKVRQTNYTEQLFVINTTKQGFVVHEVVHGINTDLAVLIFTHEDIAHNIAKAINKKDYKLVVYTWNEIVERFREKCRYVLLNPILNPQQKLSGHLFLLKEKPES